MKTYLTGGLIILTILMSLIQPEEAINIFSASSSSKDFISVLSAFLLLIAAAPIGFIVNQVWMTIYNLFFDIHNKIFPLPEEIDLKKIVKIQGESFWRRSYINEVLLALHHRKSTPLDSAEYLSWHRNRLNELHSNGTNIFSMIVGLTSCFIISLFVKKYSWVLDSAPTYLMERWWFILIVNIVVLICLFRFIRSYKMLVLYNQISLTNECMKCRITCHEKMD